MTRSREDFERVQVLLAQGRDDREIAHIAGIPRATVRAWRDGRHADAQRPSHGTRTHTCSVTHEFSRFPPTDYAYLLGMYLGDGYIAQHRRGVYRLRIVCDSRYRSIIQECSLAMEAVMPGQRAYVQQRPSRCVEVSMYSKHWPCFFPQHGPGRKHDRVIRLEAWQETFVSHEPESFVRGLIHSDGCRVTANDRGLASVRYHFSNRSEDIKRLYCDSLDRLEIPWTRPSDRDIAVYRKAATARLDQFVGPKR